jgi:chaperonin GroES
MGVDRMTVRPLHDRLVARPLEEAEQQSGGIVIPDTAEEKPYQGRVIAGGFGKANKRGKRLPLDIKRGDLIPFAKYTSPDVKIDGEELLIVPEDEALAVIKDGTEQKD